jgi:hypothetical protein
VLLCGVPGFFAKQPPLFYLIFNQSPPEPPDTYNRFLSLLETSFEPEYTFPLLKRFTFYFAKNYAFGHTLWRLVHNAGSVAKAAELANEFFSTQTPNRA